MQSESLESLIPGSLGECEPANFHSIEDMLGIRELLTRGSFDSDALLMDSFNIALHLGHYVF
jgi:hypothetical protein